MRKELGVNDEKRLGNEKRAWGMRKELGVNEKHPARHRPVF
jgi:hypothetical protein